MDPVNLLAQGESDLCQSLRGGPSVLSFAFSGDTSKFSVMFSFQ